VTGIDANEVAGVREAVDEFVCAELSTGLPKSLEGPFDIVLAADVLEHVPTPERLLEDIGAVLAPGGSVVVSVPNFVHWYPRLRILSGWFDYDRRGILDERHLRFFTRRSLERLVSNAGLSIVQEHPVGLPIEVLERGGGRRRVPDQLKRAASSLDRFLVRAWPNLFAYQYILELRTTGDLDRSQTVVPETSPESLSSVGNA
jgi:SAM-dependent methyltransferase